MDVIARLPDCAGQAADAVFACTQEKGGRSQIASKFRSQSVLISDFVFHDTGGHNRGQTLKIPWFLLSEILYGHTLAGLSWERQCENCDKMRESTELGLPLCSQKTGMILIDACGEISRWLGEAEYESRVEDIHKTGRSRRTNIIS